MAESSRDKIERLMRMDRDDRPRTFKRMIREALNDLRRNDPQFQGMTRHQIITQVLSPVGSKAA